MFYWLNNKYTFDVHRTYKFISTYLFTLKRFACKKCFLPSKPSSPSAFSWKLAYSYTLTFALPPSLPSRSPPHLHLPKIPPGPSDKPDQIFFPDYFAEKTGPICRKSHMRLPTNRIKFFSPLISRKKLVENAKNLRNFFVTLRALHAFVERIRARSARTRAHARAHARARAARARARGENFRPPGENFRPSGRATFFHN